MLAPPTCSLLLAAVGALFGSAALQAQAPDASIGRNIPGSVPRQAPDAFAEEHSGLEKKPELPQVPTIGKRGQGVLRTVVFSGGLTPGDRLQGVTMGPGVYSDRVDLIGRKKGLAKELEENYLGKPFTAETVKRITEAALKFYFRAERPMVFVQPVLVNYDTGELRFVVIEAKLDNKEATGARWFRNRFLLSRIRVKSGEYINRARLLNDLAWINQNPFLQSRITMKPGNVPGSTTLALETQDRFPVRVFSSFDNTGSDQTGVWRWTLGANWGNAFFVADQLNYQFSAAFAGIPNQPVHAASYLTPLPWHHLFAVYASYAGTDIDLGLSDHTTANYQGYQAQVSPRYTIPIGKLYGDFTNEIVIGMDWKTTDLSFLQGGTQVPSNKTSLWQFMAGYNATLTDGLGNTTLGCELYMSPGGIGGFNTDAAFEAVDPRLQANYLYGVFRLARLVKLPWNFTLANRFTGQFAGSSLISSEQLAIGGRGTVRGYPERVLFGDQGFVINMELRSPSFSVLSRLPGKLPRDQTELLAFWDLGLVNTMDPLPGDNANYFLTSVGLGARHSLGSNLTVRCDVGFPLVNPNLGFPVASARVDVGVTLGF